VVFAFVTEISGATENRIVCVNDFFFLLQSMTYINNAVMLAEEEIAGNISNKHNSKIQDKKIWKSLRTHILSRREKNKQGMLPAQCRVFLLCQ